MSHSAATDEHRRDSPAGINCGVITVSDTRTLETDRGGQLVCELLEQYGHRVLRSTIIPDDPEQMTALVNEWNALPEIQAILLTGGTGVTSRDQTYETISRLLTKPLPGYGELFRMLSYEQIGPAAMLSRALGGVMGRTIILAMPGSTAAVQLAMNKLIGPELSHLVREATR